VRCAFFSFPLQLYFFTALILRFFGRPSLSHSHGFLPLTGCTIRTSGFSEPSYFFSRTLLTDPIHLLHPNPPFPSLRYDQPPLCLADPDLISHYLLPTSFPHSIIYISLHLSFFLLHPIVKTRSLSSFLHCLLNLI
jgi:hypothetical protein